MIFSRLVDRLARRFTDLHERLDEAVRDRDAVEARLERITDEIVAADGRAVSALKAFAAREGEYTQAKQRAELLAIEVAALNAEVERLTGRKDAAAAHFDQLQADIQSREAETAKRRNGGRAHV